MDRFVNKKIEKQTIYEIYRACRLCGAGGGYKMPIIQNVVNLDSCDVELKQKIRECVQIEVHQDDKMPPLICELCVDKVNDFYEFLEMCRQTNKRTRLKLGLPPQMLPRGAPDAGDCILGVTEPIFVNDEDSNEPLSDKRSKVKGGKLKKEPEKKWKEVRVKVENRLDTRESRPSSRRAASPPRLRRDKRPRADNVTVRGKRAPSPPPKSISKKGIHKKPEVGAQSPTTRLKRSREAEVKHDTPAKKVKISLKTWPLRSSKVSTRTVSPRQARQDTERKEKQVREAQTPCPVCGAMFKKPQAMLSHRRCHVVSYTNPKLACNACELWFADAEETEAHHKRHRRQSQRYRCRRCSHSYAALHGYEEHIERGMCLPWREVPDVKCDACWRTFPTRTLLEGHRCAGSAARPGKCVKCGKSYASRRSFTNHARLCKKGDVIIDPMLRARLKTVQVRVAKCDQLLANVTQERYDVSSVSPNFGLDRNCIYPYISSGIRIKTEPSDCMVKINDMDFGSYVHWDSDDESGDSDTENLDGLDFSTFTKERKVDSLGACSLKVIFSNKFLGKVPRKFRRVKIETIINSALNDSLSYLNINGGDIVSPDTDNTVSDDKLNDKNKNIDHKEYDNLTPEVNSNIKVTNDDLNCISDDIDKTDSGYKSVTVPDDKLLADKSSDISKKIKDFDVLGSGAKNKIDKKNNDSINVISYDNRINVTENANENIENNVANENYFDSGNIQSLRKQFDDKINASEQKISVKLNLTGTNLVEESICDHEANFNVTQLKNVNGSENIMRMISLGDNQEEVPEKSKIQNYDNEISICTENTTVYENNKTLHTKSNNDEKKDEYNVKKSEKRPEVIETDTTKISKLLNTISEVDANAQIEDKDTRGSSKENNKDNGELNTTERDVEKDLEANTNNNGSDQDIKAVSETQINGDADVDDVTLNMNDLEDFSGTEFDDCELMAEIDAQIGEKKQEGNERDITIDRPKIGKITDIKKDVVYEDVKMVVKGTETPTNAELVKEKGNNEIDRNTSQNKISLEDLLPTEDYKSMDLDSVSDDEFDYND